MIDRDALVELSRLMTENPKLTLAELRQQAIDANLFDNDTAPDTSTIWRRLQTVGFRYKKPRYQDLMFMILLSIATYNVLGTPPFTCASLI